MLHVDALSPYMACLRIDNDLLNLNLCIEFELVGECAMQQLGGERAIFECVNRAAARRQAWAESH